MEPADSDFLARVRARLEEITAHEAQIRREEEALREKRSRLATERDELLHVLELYGRVMGVPVPDRPAPVTESIPVLTERFLRARGGSATVKEIVAELERLGKLRGPQANHYNVVFGALRRASQVELAGRGVFRVRGAAEH
jgi:hypothetical protein